MHSRSTILLILSGIVLTAGCLQNQSGGDSVPCADASIYLRSWAGDSQIHDYRLVLTDSSGHHHDATGTVSRADTPNPQVHGPFTVPLGDASVEAADGTVHGSIQFEANCNPTHVNITLTQTEVQFNVVQPDR